jgi:3-oxoacyl-[acyl-carrier-protein] synthase-3
MQRVGVVATGHYLPERIMTNDCLAQLVDTNDEWISSRTGIRQRHIIAEGETTADMARYALANAIASSNIDLQSIDAVIVATTTADVTFPSTAVRVQAMLGLKPGPAFDIQAVCAGFVYALSVAKSLIESGSVKTVAVIGVDAMSRLVDWSDRTTCVLFGDGAGVVILQANDESKSGSFIVASRMMADGQYASILQTDGGVASTATAGKVRMRGQEVFKHAVEKMSDIAKQLLQEASVNIDEIKWFIPHQANQRIIEAVQRRLHVPEEKIISTVANHANTSAASIPLAWDVSVKSGLIKADDLLLVTAIGGGLCWGGAIIRV